MNYSKYHINIPSIVQILSLDLILITLIFQTSLWHLLMSLTTLLIVKTQLRLIQAMRQPHIRRERTVWKLRVWSRVEDCCS